MTIMTHLRLGLHTFFDNSRSVYRKNLRLIEQFAKPHQQMTSSVEKQNNRKKKTFKFNEIKKHIYLRNLRTNEIKRNVYAI